MTSAVEYRAQFLADISRASDVMDDSVTVNKWTSSKPDVLGKVFRRHLETNIGLFKWTAALALLGKLLPYEVELTYRVESLKVIPDHQATGGIERIEGFTTSSFAKGSHPLFNSAVDFGKENVIRSSLAKWQDKLMAVQELHHRVDQYLAEMLPRADTTTRTIVVPAPPAALEDLDRDLQGFVERPPQKGSGNVYEFIFYDAKNWDDIKLRWMGCAEEPFGTAQLPALEFTALRARQCQRTINEHIINLAERAIRLQDCNAHRVAAAFFLSENGFEMAYLLSDVGDYRDVRRERARLEEQKKSCAQEKELTFSWKLTERDKN